MCPVPLSGCGSAAYSAALKKRESMNYPVPFRIKFSGEAGEGILTIGDILLEAMVRDGSFGTLYKSFPSSVRSGQSQVIVSVSEEKIITPVDLVDAVYVINNSSLSTAANDLKPGGIIIFDSEFKKISSIDRYINQLKAGGFKLYEIPYTLFNREGVNIETMKSTIALGVVSWIFSIPVRVVENILCRKLQPKGDAVVQSNRAALLNAYDLISKIPGNSQVITVRHKPQSIKKRIILDGNEALSIAAVHAGCTFFSCYPITPATSIGEFLSRILPQSGGIVYQAEDEIAALCAVSGAAFSGCRAMTATSGPGLSLMQEFISYLSMTELPAVIVDVQRLGPSTGMPTKFGQDDLLAAVFGGHGEDQRIVVSPLSVEDSIYTTVAAFNLAEKYRCPVILLSDSAMALSKDTISYPDFSQIRVQKRGEGEGYASENGYEIPYRVTGLEHTIDNVPTEDVQVRAEQIQRRFEKISLVEEENEALVHWDLESHHPYKADFAVISWGFTASVVMEAVRRIREMGYSVAACYPKLLYPVCKNAIERLILYSSRIIIPEANFMGQYSSILRMYVNITPVSIRTSDGEPLLPDEIVKQVVELAGCR